ncbi:MAG: MFS transporter [Erysipelotrichaceae bacterium]|nr:MFS transporter [Erysipelotrichaceae bacterium]
MPKLRIYHLSVLAACCLMAAASMGLSFYPAGLFYEPVSQGLNASVGSVSAVTFFVLLALAVSSLFVPWLLKAVPFKALMGAGLALEAGGTAMMAFAFGPAWLYFCALFQGAGAGICGMVTAAALISSWFYDNHGTRLSIAFAAGAAGAALLSPVLGFCLSSFGWRLTYVIQAGLAALLLLPCLVLPVEAFPERLGQVPSGTLRPEKEACAARFPKVFSQTVLICVLAALLVGIPQHFGNYALSIGLDLQAGASMLAWAMTGNVVFKLAAAAAGRFCEPPAALLGLCAVSAAGLAGLLISMAFPNRTAVLLPAFLAGSIYGLADLSAPLLIEYYFGRKKYVRLYAALNFAEVMMSAVSISLAGWMYDLALNYVWILSAALTVCAIIALLLYLMRRKNRIPESWRESASRLKSAFDSKKKAPDPAE